MTSKEKAKQTAVEWLQEQYYESEGKLTKQDFEQAKEMGKQQIIDAHLIGQSLVSCKDEYAKQYYNETFQNKIMTPKEKEIKFIEQKAELYYLETMTPKEKAKQTAVEWLQAEIDNKDMGEIPMWIYDFCQQAKEMEKQQMDKIAGDFWNEGASYMYDGTRNYESFEEYYNETYNIT